MLFKIITLMMFNLSLLFLIMKTPLSLGLILIFQTLMMTLILGYSSQSFWFSYILFLVIIGGMLILFIYVISLMFNKILNYNLNLNLNLLFLFISMNMFFLINDNIIKFNNNEYLSNYQLYNKEMINLLKLYNFPMNMINIFMINYLFFLLIVVVKITNFFYGPIRMKI